VDRVRDELGRAVMNIIPFDGQPGGGLRRPACWDYAAAAQLLSEAGGWTGTTEGTNLLEALPFEYSGGWVAALPNLRDQLLAVGRARPW
jgi:hypothetical protein